MKTSNNQQESYNSPLVMMYRTTTRQVICGSVNENPTATGQDFDDPSYE